MLGAARTLFIAACCLLGSCYQLRQRPGAVPAGAEELREPDQAADFDAFSWPGRDLARDTAVDQSCRQARQDHPEFEVRGVDDLPGYKALFQRLAGKRVLLVGDSFMRNFFKALRCASEFFGVQPKEPKVVDLTKTLPQWEQDDKVFYWSVTVSGVPRSLIHSPPSSPSSGHDGRRNRSETFGFQVGLLHYYTLTETCTDCSFVEGEPCNCEEDIVPTPVDFFVWRPKMAGESMKLRMQTLAHLIYHDYDEAVITMGHDMMKWMPQRDVNRIVKRKLQRLWQVMEEEERAVGRNQGATADLRSRITFMEHYAQHFPKGTQQFPEGGTGDFDGISNHTSCSCDLPRLRDQLISQRLHVLREFCDEHGLRVARAWQYTALNGCTLHTAPDCSHYAPVPKFWDPIALEVAAGK